MVDPKSTNDIRLIATDVVGQQERVCQARRDGLSDKLHTLSDLAQSNMKAIADLAKAVAVLAESVKPLPASIKENEDSIEDLKSSVHQLTRRPAFWAAVGSALPVAAGVLWELIRTKP